jgi:hypothetical protein
MSSAQVNLSSRVLWRALIASGDVVQRAGILNAQRTGHVISVCLRCATVSVARAQAGNAGIFVFVEKCVIARPDPRFARFGRLIGGDHKISEKLQRAANDFSVLARQLYARSRRTDEAVHRIVRPRAERVCFETSAAAPAAAAAGRMTMNISVLRSRIVGVVGLVSE